MNRHRLLNATLWKECGILSLSILLLGAVLLWMAGCDRAPKNDSMNGDGQAPNGLIDINSASEETLTTLPGITGTLARRIIERRPYTAPHNLVNKGVLREAQYARLSAKITAN